MLRQSLSQLLITACTIARVLAVCLPGPKGTGRHRLQVCRLNSCLTDITLLVRHSDIYTHGKLLGPCKEQLRISGQRTASHVSGRCTLSWRLAVLRWQAHVYALPTLRAQDVLCFRQSRWHGSPPILAVALHQRGLSDPPRKTLALLCHPLNVWMACAVMSLVTTVLLWVLDSWEHVCHPKRRSRPVSC